jgi:hypothetical protein
MQERLSSSWTFYYKVVLPVVWIGGFGLGTIILWTVNSAGSQLQLNVIRGVFFFVWLVGSSFILWFAVRLKAVTLSEGTLIVANFRQEIRIPLSSINEIRESRLVNPKTIKLTLYPPCDFGEKVVFIPKIKFYNPFGQHPIVKQLKELTHKG